MYNVTEIQNCFAGLVGFYQPVDPQYPKIDDSLTVSKSGKYVQRAHPLCTIENLYNVAPNFDGFIYPIWSAEIYPAGAIVMKDSINYEATVITAAADVPGVSNKWVKANPFSAWLKEMYKNACSNLVSELLKRKKINNAGRSLLDSLQLYSGFGSVSDRIIKHGSFVGLQIVPRKNENIMVEVNRLGFQVDTTQTINFYLYHSSQIDPIKVIPVEIVRANSFTWIDLTDVVMSYMNGNQNANGVFYLGYYESDLQGQAIRMNTTLQNAPCLTCNSYDISAFNAWSKFIGVAGIRIPETALNDDRTIFDCSKITYPIETNFGINLSLSVTCDLTQFFCTSKMLFADALVSQLAIEILKELAFTTRMNGISDTTKKTAGYELNDDPKSRSFLVQHLEAIKALDLDFSGFDANCLPCQQRSGIYMGAI